MSAVPSKIKVAFSSRQVKDPVMKALKQLLKAKHPQVELIYKKALADYWILNQANSIALCQPATERPVFKSVPITDEQEDGAFTSALLFHQQLLQVAHFEQVSKLANPANTNGITEALDLQLAEVTNHQDFQQAGTLVAKDPNEPLFLDYYAHNGQLVNPAIQLNVKNKTADSLWVTALFLGEDYGIVDIFMPVKEVKAGEPYAFTMPADKDPVIGLGISEELLGWGIQDIQNQIKIISSRSSFTVDKLLQSGLVQAVNTTRAGVFTDTQPTATTIRTEDPNWTVQDIVLHIHRPQSGLATSSTESVPLRGMQIMPHSAFSAEKVRLSSSENGTRSGLLEEKSPIDIFNTPYIQPYQQTGTRASQQTLDIIELHGIQNPEAVTAENPLRVKLDVPLETGKVVIPFGYDKATDLYIPMGFVDEDGQTILIDSLPDESEASTRGFFKSIKIFLVETVRKVTGRKPKYPILALADVKDKVGDDYELNYIKDTNKIKEAVKKANKILVMVHGLIGDTSDQAKIMKRIIEKDSMPKRTLSDAYDILLTFDYESVNRKIQKTGKDLKEKLEAVGIKKGHGKEVYIIAHSMGGLVSRWYLEKEGGQEVINHFIQVGSPNLGSPLADKALLATTTLGAVLNFIPKPPIVAGAIRLVGKLWKKITVTTEQLQPSSDFYKKLNGNVPEITIPYTLLTGDITLGGVDPKQQKFFEKMLRRYGHQLFGEGNDGVVSLSSMEGDKVLDREMVKRLPAVPCNHFSYFNTRPGEIKLAEVLFKLAKENPNA